MNIVFVSFHLYMKFSTLNSRSSLLLRMIEILGLDPSFKFLDPSVAIKGNSVKTDKHRQLSTSFVFCRCQVHLIPASRC